MDLLNFTFNQSIHCQGFWCHILNQIFKKHCLQNKAALVLWKLFQITCHSLNVESIKDLQLQQFTGLYVQKMLV